MGSAIQQRGPARRRVAEAVAHDGGRELLVEHSRRTSSMARRTATRCSTVRREHHHAGVHDVDHVRQPWRTTIETADGALACASAPQGHDVLHVRARPDVADSRPPRQGAHVALDAAALAAVEPRGSPARPRPAAGRTNHVVAPLAGDACGPATATAKYQPPPTPCQDTRTPRIAPRRTCPERASANAKQLASLSNTTPCQPRRRSRRNGLRSSSGVRVFTQPSRRTPPGMPSRPEAPSATPDRWAMD